MSERDPLLHADTDVEASAPDDEPEPKQSSYDRAKLRTAEFLESAPLHYTVITLVIIDSACVLADLGYTFLSADCTPIEGPDAPLWLSILAQISLAITTLFLVEIPVTLWASGWSFYNPFAPEETRTPHAALHCFDAVVILTTFILEVVLRGKERELASLLVILRMWRLVKLVQGIAVSAGELNEEEAKELAKTRQELREALSALDEARQENAQLRSRLGWAPTAEVASDGGS